MGQVRDLCGLEVLGREQGWKIGKADPGSLKINVWSSGKDGSRKERVDQQSGHVLAASPWGRPLEVQ